MFEISKLGVSIHHTNVGYFICCDGQMLLLTDSELSTLCHLVMLAEGKRLGLEIDKRAAARQGIEIRED
jgi:hypothetical protein